MFENTGEIVVLGLAILIVWMTAWAIAERRTASTLAASYEFEASRARHRIVELEEELVQRPNRTKPVWVGEDPTTVRTVDPSYAATA